MGTVLFIMKLIAIALQAMKAVEPLFADGGGQTKKGLVLRIVDRVKDAMEGGLKREEWKPLVSGIIDDAVQEFNAQPSAWADPGKDVAITKDTTVVLPTFTAPPKR